MPAKPPTMLALACHAMATRFEIVLAGDDPVALRAAGEEALEEIRRVDAQLSLYSPSSEVAFVNANAASQPVRISPSLFTLIERAKKFSELSNGSFDITVAPLVRAWGFMKGSGSPPSPDQISEAGSLVGMEQLRLDSHARSLAFEKQGMMLDFGAIGKGYALDLAVEILREAGVTNALLHGGTSTIVGMGPGPEGAGWKVVVERPPLPGESQDKTPELVSVVHLLNQSLSVSAFWGKYFELNGKHYGHVIDPRTGWPAQNAILGAVLSSSATESDALSTAVLLSSPADLESLASAVPGLNYLQLAGESGETTVTRGFELFQPAAAS